MGGRHHTWLILSFTGRSGTFAAVTLQDRLSHKGSHEQFFLRFGLSLNTFTFRDPVAVKPMGGNTVHWLNIPQQHPTFLMC